MSLQDDIFEVEAIIEASPYPGVIANFDRLIDQLNEAEAEAAAATVIVREQEITIRNMMRIEETTAYTGRSTASPEKSGVFYRGSSVNLAKFLDKDQVDQNERRSTEAPHHVWEPPHI